MFTERTKNILFLVVLGMIFWFIVCVIDSGSLPERWSWTQSVAGEYDVKRDWTVSKSGKASAHIASKAGNPKGFASVRQEFRPFPYRGSRIRMEAYVKTALSRGSAYLWLQVYNPQGRILYLDNMSDHPITGITDWTKHEIVIDVPREARTITFGFGLSGKGEAWVDDFSFQAVGKDAGSTEVDWLQRPVNLGFE